MAAKAEKDPKTGKWLIQYRYTDWQGNRKKSMKRGFKTKREAEEWLQNFLATKQADFNMLFEDFLKIYYSLHFLCNLQTNELYNLVGRSLEYVP